MPALAACCRALTACASIMHASAQDIGVASSPTNASVTVDNATKAQTPFVADLTLTRGTFGWVWGNIIFGGIIGPVVDAMTGGLYNLTPDQLTTTLARQAASISPAKDGAATTSFAFGSRFRAQVPGERRTMN